MGKLSRDKGERFERTLAARLRQYGYDTHRSAQYRGNVGNAPDVVGLPGIHIEAKHCEAMRLYDWMAQAKHDAALSDGNPIPAVFHKKNNAEILVTLEFEDFMQIYVEWEAGRNGTT